MARRRERRAVCGTCSTWGRPTDIAVSCSSEFLASPGAGDAPQRCRARERRSEQVLPRARWGQGGIGVAPSRHSSLFGCAQAALREVAPQAQAGHERFVARLVAKQHSVDGLEKLAEWLAAKTSDRESTRSEILPRTCDKCGCRGDWHDK